MAKIYWEDFDAGLVLWGNEVVVDRDEMVAYAQSYDPWPFHVDEAAAARTPVGGLIASGGYTISLWFRSNQGVWFDRGDDWQLLGGFDWQLRFVRPVRAGERLRNRWTLLEKTPSRSKPDRGVWRALNEFMDADEDIALRIESAAMLARRE